MFLATAIFPILLRASSQTASLASPRAVPANLFQPVPTDASAAAPRVPSKAVLLARFPAGHYSGDLGNFGYVRESTSFWTSTTAGTLYYSDAIHLNNRDRKASLVTPDRRNGFSIRCLMD